MTHHALTPELLTRLHSPQGLLVHLRHLSDENFAETTITMKSLEVTHPLHWESIRQIAADRKRLESQGGTSWRE